MRIHLKSKPVTEQTNMKRQQFFDKSSTAEKKAQQQVIYLYVYWRYCEYIWIFIYILEINVVIWMQQKSEYNKKNKHE